MNTVSPSFKRSAEDAGLDDHASAKHSRPDDSPAALDPVILDKLNDLYSRGVAKPDEFDNRALSQLAEFPPQDAVGVLEQFERSDQHGIRNKSAYLIGVINRYRRSMQPGPQQHRDVQHLLDTLFRTKQLKVTDLDVKCYEAIANFPPAIACGVLDRFVSKDLSQVRNMSAFFMAHLKQERTGSGGPSGMGMPGGPPPGLPPVPGMPGPAPPMVYPPLGPPPVPGPPFGLDALLMPPAAALLPPPGPFPMQPPVAGKHNYMIEQMSLGVRVDEFHNLSVFAQCVHPAPALKLQQLWDQGVRLVSLLDDRSWEVLSSLKAPEALLLIEEVADNMAKQHLRNVNAFFMATSRKYQGGHQVSAGRPTMSGHMPLQGRPPYGGGGGHGGSHGALDQLQPAVKAKAQEYMQRFSRYLFPQHFDEGIVQALNRLNEVDALAVLDELASNDLSTVRNLPAYLMGICKRYEKGGRR